MVILVNFLDFVNFYPFFIKIFRLPFLGDRTLHCPPCTCPCMWPTDLSVFEVYHVVVPMLICIFSVSFDLKQRTSPIYQKTSRNLLSFPIRTTGEDISTKSKRTLASTKAQWQLKLLTEYMTVLCFFSWKRLFFLPTIIGRDNK